MEGSWAFGLAELMRTAATDHTGMAARESSRLTLIALCPRQQGEASKQGVPARSFTDFFKLC
jgi:hypothetical protein